MIAVRAVPPTNLVSVVIAVTVPAVAVFVPVIVAVVMLVAAMSVAVFVGDRHTGDKQHRRRTEAYPPFRSHGNPRIERLFSQDYWP
jgi:hypothetical protein